MEESNLHGPNCQCLTCTLDRYKRERGADAWNWSSLPQNYSSVALGMVAGSIVTLIGMMWFKQYRSNAYGSLSSTTLNSKTISNEPLVLINNATDTRHNIITADPSVGILYAPTTGLYEVELSVNVQSSSGTPTGTILQIMVVKNGLPTDSAAQLMVIQQGLTAGMPQSLTLHGYRCLKGEDYIQVFAISSNATVQLFIQSFDFSMKLIKIQAEG